MRHEAILGKATPDQVAPSPPGQKAAHRANRVVAPDPPDLTSRILRATIAKIDAAAAKAGETAELLANVRVAVED
jgi:hypothetical protein